MKIIKIDKKVIFSCFMKKDAVIKNLNEVVSTQKKEEEVISNAIQTE
jgi:hypothetical protein